MAKDDATLEISGLQISNSTFSASPPGSLRQAEECVMPQKGVLQPRRGQGNGYSMPSAADIAWSITQFGGVLVDNYAPSKDSTSYGLQQAGQSAYSGGPYNPVDISTDGEFAARMKFAQANEYLYFCAESGPKALEDAAGPPRAAGLLRMPDPEAAMGSASALPAVDGAGLEYGFSRAYRTVLRKPTSNGTSLLSPPSGRTVVQNRILAPAGTIVRASNVVTVTLPGTDDPGLDPGDTVDLTPGEGGNFPAGPQTVVSVTDNVFTYNDVGADATNLDPQDYDTGPRPVSILVWLPTDATTSTPVRIYRSRDVDGTDPGDEMFLVAEVFPNSTNISNGFLVYADFTPQSVTYDPLYTNPQTGEGAAQANLQPPLYRDVANWSGFMWYANTTGQQQFRFQMLGVGPDDGVQDGDTLTIAGEVFTFKTTVTTLGDVEIVDTGTPSFNIQQTSQNLVQMVNYVFDGAGIDIRIYFESTQNGAPGKMLIEAISYEQAAFAVRASRPETWTPALSSIFDVDSTAERVPNRIMYSKAQQPEAVPALNYVSVGSKSYPIGRILGLQQALLVFKEGDGIWTVSGSAPFQVQQISNANIIARDAACVFSDATWVYTDQGVLRVSDSGGATVVSRPIETELNALYGKLPDETIAYSFMVPYEQERRLLLFVPFDFLVDDGPDRPILRAWCYCEATQAWTGPLYSDVFSGVVSRGLDGVLAHPRLELGAYLAALSTGLLTRERRDNSGSSLSQFDYADYYLPVTITGVNVGGDPLIVTLSSVANVEEGDLLLRIASVSPAVTRYSTVVALRPDISATAVELCDSQAWTTGSAFLAKHYTAIVQLQPQGNPTARKTLTRLTWLFKPENYVTSNASTTIETDQIQAVLDVPSPFVGFGSATNAAGGGFGVTPFGDPTPLVYDVNPIDAKWANAGQFFLGLDFPVCGSIFKLEGFSVRLETADGPTGRGK